MIRKLVSALAIGLTVSMAGSVFSQPNTKNDYDDIVKLQNELISPGMYDDIERSFAESAVSFCRNDSDCARAFAFYQSVMPKHFAFWMFPDTKENWLNQFYFEKQQPSSIAGQFCYHPDGRIESDSKVSFPETLRRADFTKATVLVNLYPCSER